MSADGVSTDRRRFLTGAATVVGGVGAAFTAWPFAASWAPSERAKALGAPVEFDLSVLEPGMMNTIEWRGQPVFIVRRSKDVLSTVEAQDDKVRDPDSEKEQQPDYAKNKLRSIKPEYLVLLGVCTHLGCAPKYVRATDNHVHGPEWQGGFFCPCHGSKFDLAGRVFQGVPAPTNLKVPPHKYLNDSTILVGEDQETA